MSFEFGASDIPNNVPTYASSVTFDISSDHKIDGRAAGRYLSYKMTVSDNDAVPLQRLRHRRDSDRFTIMALSDRTDLLIKDYLQEVP